MTKSEIAAAKNDIEDAIEIWNDRVRVAELTNDAYGVKEAKSRIDALAAELAELTL
jgi:hypothetical protein